jgi:hypothetical protein
MLSRLSDNLFAPAKKEQVRTDKKDMRSGLRESFESCINFGPCACIQNTQLQPKGAGGNVRRTNPARPMTGLGQNPNLPRRNSGGRFTKIS